MHLRSIPLRGFKSFPDPVEVRLEPGVAIVVGPNGSGKSNVADGIVWAAGSLSPTELRAEKPDDVLYAGSRERPPADFCEVELLFDNEDGQGPVDFSELSIARRLHREGEGEYLINRAHVRRTDVVELLADIGLGGDMHSVIGQGRVEQILASKPAERRALVEEAAGLGKFKRRRHRAELKLARVQIQVERARDLEDEVRKRLRPLALQASAAARAEKLRVEVEGIRGRIAAAELERLERQLAEVEERKTEALQDRRLRDERLNGVLEERRRAEDELSEAATRHEKRNRGALPAPERDRACAASPGERRGDGEAPAGRGRAAAASDRPRQPGLRARPGRRERMVRITRGRAVRGGRPPGGAQADGLDAVVALAAGEVWFASGHVKRAEPRLPAPTTSLPWPRKRRRLGMPWLEPRRVRPASRRRCVRASMPAALAPRSSARRSASSERRRPSYGGAAVSRRNGSRPSRSRWPGSSARSATSSRAYRERARPRR